jgi:HEPN domain-containing protein
MTETGSQYLSRALDFINSAEVLCKTLNQGWLQSACLLIGMASELLAKKQLLENGVQASALRNPPYGHDLIALWQVHTNLYAEAELILQDVARPKTFDFTTHFEALAKGHSKEGNYSLRYHGGVRSFADPAVLGVIVAEIARRKRMRST